MSTREENKGMTIRGMLPNVKDFKLEKPQTLFEPPWYVVKEGLCPLCGRKLQKMQTKKGWICRGKKHPKEFVTLKDPVSTPHP